MFAYSINILKITLDILISFLFTVWYHVTESWLILSSFFHSKIFYKVLLEMLSIQITGSFKTSRLKKAYTNSITPSDH